MQAVKDSLELNLLWTELVNFFAVDKFLQYFFPKDCQSHLSQSLNNGETHWFNVKATLFPFCTSCKENYVFIDNE